MVVVVVVVVVISTVSCVFGSFTIETKQNLQN